MKPQRTHLPVFQNTAVMMMSVTSIRAVVGLVKKAFNAKNHKVPQVPSMKQLWHGLLKRIAHVL